MGPVDEADKVTHASDSERSTIEKVLKENRTVAVVGLSADPERPSFKVAQYLQAHGYHIIPVNPSIPEALGQRAYPDLLSIPEPVAVVDIFRRSEAVAPIVAQAIQIKAKVIWMQEGVMNEQAAQQAKSAGLLVVMNHCMLKETRRLITEGILPGK